MAKSRISAIGPEVSNGAALTISFSEPYAVEFRLQGTSDLLFHRWLCEEVEGKATGPKGGRGKKVDNVESYVWRNDAGELCIPGEYVRQAIIHAAKFRQDPRSPRKSAMDLFKAGIAALSTLASTGLKDWDYLHKGRVMIQRNGITRVRPALFAGWVATFRMAVLLPEYIGPDLLHEVLTTAGKVIGIADFRPTYGRFSVTSWEVGLL